MSTLLKIERRAAAYSRVRRYALEALYVVLSCAVSACLLGPDFVRPKAPTDERYTYEEKPFATVAAKGGVQYFHQGAGIAADWWRLFNCAKLDTVVMESFANNPTLQAAIASLRQSQDNLRAGYGVFYPALSASFQPTRQQFSPARFGQTSGSSIFNLYTLSTAISYTLDVWGGERRMVEGLGAQVDVQYYTALGTYLTLSGNIVNAIVAEAAYSAEIKATEQIVEMMQEQVAITQAQARAGTTAYTALLSLQTQLEETRATLPPLRQQLAHTRHLLATLAGRGPADWAPPRVEFADLKLPNDIPVTLPSDLVRQRPDILAAEAVLHNSSAQIGVATAALFPSFTLNANYGWNSTALSSLFASNAAFWTMGAALATPVLQGPTLWYQRKAAIDAWQQSAATYRQVVLAALAQVADALDALQHDAQTLRSQSQALRAAAEDARLTGINYQAGTVNYLQVLIANNQYFQAQLGYLQATGQRLQDTAALFVALGGGWWNNRLPVNSSTLQDAADPMILPAN